MYTSDSFLINFLVLTNFKIGAFMKYNISFIESLTGMSKRVRNDLQNYFSRLPENVRIEVYRYQSDIAKEMREERIKGFNAEFTYSTFLLGVRRIRNLENKVAVKSGVLSQFEEERINNIRLSRIKNKNKPKPDNIRSMIENKYFVLISTLRGEGVSWRDISTYIKRYHKTTISHDYMCKIYKELDK